jgi:ATP-binding cassette subfamily B protein
VASKRIQSISCLDFKEAGQHNVYNNRKAVMAAVEGLSKDLTIVMIAHRLIRVQSCDHIVMLKNGVRDAN